MKRVLAIGAHPDDIEIGCGGTLARLNSLGYETTHLLVTSGEEGGAPETRERESEVAARRLGSRAVLFLREPDGLTFFTKEMKIKIIRVLREVRPNIVFTHARADHFPDHRVVHELTMAAVLAAAGPWYPDAGAGTHATEEVLGYEVWNPIGRYQRAVDVSTLFGRKLDALRAHASQLQGVDYLEAVEGLARYRGAMSMSGARAEVFEVLKAGGFE